jgi:hypothetical protein
MKENGQLILIQEHGLVIKEAKPFEKLLLCFFKEENYNHIPKVYNG